MKNGKQIYSASEIKKQAEKIKTVMEQTDDSEQVFGITADTIGGLIGLIDNLSDEVDDLKEKTNRAIQRRNDAVEEIWKLIKKIRYTAMAFYGDQSEMAYKFGGVKSLFKKAEEYIN